MIANGAAEDGEHDEYPEKCKQNTRAHSAALGGVICYCFLAYLKAPLGASCMAAKRSMLLLNYDR